MAARAKRRAQYAALDRLYEMLPALRCKGLCQDSCGPIGMSEAEAARLPRLVVVDEHLTCSLLVDGRCSAYAVRPLICRLWGSVASMRCPHGCVPSAVLTDGRARAMLDAARTIGGPDVYSIPLEVRRV